MQDETQSLASVAADAVARRSPNSTTVKVGIDRIRPTISCSRHLIRVAAVRANWTAHADASVRSLSTVTQKYVRPFSTYT